MKNTNTDERILTEFFNHPNKEFHIRELSRITSISPPAIINAVERLNKRKLLNVERGISNKIKANLDNGEFKYLKRVNNINNIYSPGLNNFLKENFPLSTIILFGSHSRGEDNEKSDIDIAIIEAKEKKLNFENFEKVLKRKINLDFVDINKCSKELRNSIINGISLAGYIKI